MKTAPIALFVYNRPEHTKTTLEYLSKNEYADESDLYIYSDGPKPDSSEECIQNIAKVRQIADCIKWAKRTEVIKREKNLGLAQSIVSGVGELCRKYGRVIVLEDDLIVSKGFLSFMNAALHKYRDNSEVYQISGYSFPIKSKNNGEAYFLPLTTTWGWATWERAWEIYDENLVGIRAKLQNSRFRKKIDLDGAYPYSKIMMDHLNGKNDSWGIMYWWAVCKRNGLVLYPSESLVENIGFDGTGTNCIKVEDGNNSLSNSRTNSFTLKLPNVIMADIDVFNIVKIYLRKRFRRNYLNVIMFYMHNIITFFKRKK